MMFIDDKNVIIVFRLHIAAYYDKNTFLLARKIPYRNSTHRRLRELYVKIFNAFQSWKHLKIL